ncbi:hypothetical protein [Chitinophaga varians]|uniref:hypothetical protein n=1 Tax=Chitinophaga varians TaxID=2202339 RepID=UPI00165F6EA1|nr:hypothetical protein [Chitinophaga varians]MBC9915100.1 hypothetical protein [Chitinophaga varians]
MKKVKVLFSAFAVLAFVAAVVAVKANPQDTIFVPDPSDPHPTICPVAVNLTLLPNGTPVSLIATTVQNDPIAPNFCSLRSVYQPQ